MSFENAPQELRDAIQRSDSLYEAASPEWFDFLADDATVYSVGSVEPFKGKGQYREHFEAALTAEKRSLKVLARDLQLLGDKAVQAQTSQIQQGQIVATIRQSLVWRNEGGRWQIEHLHTTLLGQPTGPTPDSPHAVKVLNEQIATVAAVVGVAQ